MFKNWFGKSKKVEKINQLDSFGENLSKIMMDETLLAVKKACESLPVDTAKVSNAEMTFTLFQLSWDVQKNDPEELTKALTLLKSAAYEGHPQAQHVLAEMYLSSQYVEHDIASAHLLLLNSSKENFAPAQYKLGYLLLKGEIFKKDVDAGKYWLEKSADNQNVSAMNSLGVFYLFGDSDLGKNEKKAVEWLTRASTHNHPTACFLLANHLKDNGNHDKELIKGLTKTAAEQGHRDAQYNLAILYNSPSENDYNPQEAFIWLEKAALQNQISAQYALAVYHLDGIGTSKNIHKAIECFETAAGNNHAKALHALGVFYEKGIGVSEDLNKAVEYYEKGTALNDSSSMVNLALIYKNCNDSESLNDMAAYLLNRAAMLGNDQALNILQHM